MLQWGWVVFANCHHMNVMSFQSFPLLHSIWLTWKDFCKGSDPALPTSLQNQDLSMEDGSNYGMRFLQPTCMLEDAPEHCQFARVHPRSLWVNASVIPFIKARWVGRRCEPSSPSGIVGQGNICNWELGCMSGPTAQIQFLAARSSYTTLS